MKTESEQHLPSQDGFTLLELLIVMVIIAILASIAIPTYLSARREAQDSARLRLCETR